MLIGVREFSSQKTRHIRCERGRVGWERVELIEGGKLRGRLREIESGMRGVRRDMKILKFNRFPSSYIPFIAPSRLNFIACGQLIERDHLLFHVFSTKLSEKKKKKTGDSVEVAGHGSKFMKQEIKTKLFTFFR